MKKKLRMDPRPGQGRGAEAWRGPRATPRTSSTRPRTAFAPTPTSCARCASSRSTTVRPRSTSPTPSATACPGLRQAHPYVIDSVPATSSSRPTATTPRTRRGELAGRRLRRRAPGGVRDQRARRERRQRALEEIVMAIRTRPTTSTGRDRRCAPRLARTSRMVSHSPATPCSTTRRSSAGTRSRTRPGSTSTACSRNRTYEIIEHPPVGQEAAQIVLGKHSVRQAFADSLDKMGLHLQGHPPNQAFARFKELADRKVRSPRPTSTIVAEDSAPARAPLQRGRDSTFAAARFHPEPRRAGNGDGKVEADRDGNGTSPRPSLRSREGYPRAAPSPTSRSRR